MNLGLRVWVPPPGVEVGNSIPGRHELLPMPPVSPSRRERFIRMMWELRMINGLDAQRARDLAERDAIRAWLQRDGERVLPLP